MARAPVIVSTAWLEECVAMGELLRPADYPLKDPEGERHYQLKLPEVLKRARANGGRLLAGQTIWVTENIYGGFETYKAIIRGNGGTCQPFHNRTAISFREYAGSDDEMDVDGDDKHVYLVSGSTPAESRLWPKFQEEVRSGGRIPRVVRTDWMLDLALSQRIRWNDSYELTNDDD
jgi:hypothetical protein